MFSFLKKKTAHEIYKSRVLNAADKIMGALYKNKFDYFESVLILEKVLFELKNSRGIHNESVQEFDLRISNLTKIYTNSMKGSPNV